MCQMMRRRPWADQSDLRTAELVIAAMSNRWPGRAHKIRHTMRRIYLSILRINGRCVDVVTLLWAALGHHAATLCVAPMGIGLAVTTLRPRLIAHGIGAPSAREFP